MSPALRLAAFMTCAALCLFTTPAAARRIVYGIAIGNNQPPAGQALAKLEYADDDAIRYHDLFQRSGKHAALLTVMDPKSERRHSALSSVARPPTLVELAKTLDAFRRSMAEDKRRGDEPVLFLAYSGHGARDEQQQYFLSFLDGGLTQAALYDEILAKLAGFEVHLVVDACNAAGVVGVRGAFDRERDAEVVALGEGTTTALIEARSLSRFPMVGALVATSVGQEAHEWSRIESGIFTHEVLSALLGAADVNGDLKVEYSEVQAFVAAANRGVADSRAVPNILAHPPAGIPHATLSDLSSFSRTMLVVATARELGRLSVSLADGRRFLDAHALGPERVVLAVPAEAGIYVGRGDVEAELPVRPLVLFETLQLRPARASARGPLERTLRDQLFSTPFTVDYYRGFVDSHGTTGVDFSVSPRALPASVPAGGDRAQSSPGWIAPTLLAVSGAALVTSVVATVLAVDARNDFESTDLQRQATELRERHDRYVTVAVVSGVLAAAAGVGAFVTWPRDRNEETAGGVTFAGVF